MTTQGQMLPNTERGQILMDTINKYKPKTILEIGTWKGLGSTKCIIESIDYECNFISLETNHEFYEIAKNNLKDYLNKVTLLFGTIVSRNEVIEFVSTISINETQKNWLNEDLQNLNKCPNVIDIIPESIDLILFDGGEFSTYPEWIKLKNRCKIISLDDIRELKTNQIYNELINDSEYTLLHETSDGNGFCVFIKK